MDYISSLAYSIDNPLIKGLSLIIDNYFAYGTMVLVLVLYSQKREQDRVKLLASIVLTMLIVGFAKDFFGVARPCFGVVSCPPWYSFPSMHAAIAFCIMAANMNKKEYWIYFLFAVIVSFSRMNIGAHTFTDIAGAIPIALISYYSVDFAYRQKEAKKNG